MLEKTQKEQADIKKELSQNESVLNTKEKLDAQSSEAERSTHWAISSVVSSAA